MSKHVAVVTNVMDYAGSPVAVALAAEAIVTLCHSENFATAGAWADSERSKQDG